LGSSSASSAHNKESKFNNNFNKGIKEIIPPDLFPAVLQTWAAFHAIRSLPHAILQ
jgi:hypothetical protein